MACLIKTHSLVLSSSHMTSDQRIMHIIIIPLWVVFLLYFSSCILAVHRRSHVALNWPFKALEIFFLSFHSLLCDPEKFRLLIFYTSVRFNSTFQTPTVFMSIVSFYSTQLFSFTYLPLQPLSSASAVWLPPNLHVCFSLFWRVLEGFTKTAICQGHGLHFAICCQIKLGEVVHPSLFGLPLPSTIYPSTSRLTCWECKRWWEKTWKSTKVQCLRLVAISWHPIVPFLIVYAMIDALATTTTCEAFPYCVPNRVQFVWLDRV